MFVRRFYDDDLAQASYLIGSPATGEAIVIDPNRDIEQYLAGARAEGLRITHVSETHIHADFVSGARALAARTGATLLLSAEGGTDWQYAFAAADGATLLHDGDRFKVGTIRFEVMHTPGHTPEHIAFLVTNTAATEKPMALVSGDFVFVGDVGRPDLLEKAARQAGTMVDGAKTLFRSLERFRSLPDHLQVWPGHGAGSACGKSLGAVPSTTVGYEKIANWGVATTDEASFVQGVLDGQPEPPAYFAIMKRVNRDGPPRELHPLAVPVLPADSLGSALANGSVVVDTRTVAAHAAGHVPGTINIPVNRSFATWAGSLVPYDRDVLLIAADEAGATRAVRALVLIGIDRVTGWVPPDAVAAWSVQHGTLSTARNISVGEARNRVEAGDAVILDVRRQAEWESGHVPGAVHIPLGDLPSRLADLPGDREIVVHCQSGSRSAIAASVLRAAGRADVRNLEGGIVAWRREQGPLTAAD
jgi:hydroxyacylglutathione hydrolase